MSTRTRTTSQSTRDPLTDESARSDVYGPSFGLDDEISDEDIENFEHYLGRTQAEPKQGFFNLPTLAGLSTIGVGVAYLLQELGLFTAGLDISALLGPWLIGVLIILVGFGVLSWSPNRRRGNAARRKAAERRRTHRRKGSTLSRDERRSEPKVSWTERRRAFTKSTTNKKIAGVCGGIGEYLGVDPTIIRIAFVVALIASGTTAVPLYLLLAIVMPHPDKGKPALPEEDPDDERVIIVR